MNKLKVVTIVGTRPEIIRLSRVIARLDEHCNHVLVHTGQNYDYELNQIFFDDLGSTQAGSLPGQRRRERCGDDRQRHHRGRPRSCRRSSRMRASARRHQQLPRGRFRRSAARFRVFHMEAGNRCFDQRVPEEINRRIVDHTADVNLTYSSIAREYLLRGGPAAGPGHQDRQPDVRGSDALPAEDRCVRGARATWIWRRKDTLSSARIARRTSTRRAHLRKPGGRAQRCRRELRPARHRLDPSPDAEAHRRRAGVRFVTAIRLLKPLGFQRLRKAANVGARGVLGQRHHQRGVVDPQLPRAQSAGSARAAGRHGGSRGNDGRARG